MILHKAFQVRWTSHSQLSAVLHSHPSGSDGSCGVYGTINNMWLYFLCVVSYQRLMRGDKMFFFLVNVTLHDQRRRALAQKLVRLLNLINADEKSAFSFFRPQRFVRYLCETWGITSAIMNHFQFLHLLINHVSTSRYSWHCRPASLGRAPLSPSGQWFHVSTQPNFNLNSHPEDYTSLRSNKGSFGVCPVSQSQIFCRCFSPCSSCPMPDWSSLERDSCLLLQELSLETSGQCGQSTYFILCIRFPLRKKKSVCVTQANKSFCAYSLFPRFLKSTQLYYHVPNRWSR